MRHFALTQIDQKNTYTYMNTKSKLHEELRNLLRNESHDGDMFDMTPIMSEIYYWGLHNISNKELKRIIKLYKKI